MKTIDEKAEKSKPGYAPPKMVATAQAMLEELQHIHNTVVLLRDIRGAIATYMLSALPRMARLIARAEGREEVGHE